MRERDTHTAGAAHVALVGERPWRRRLLHNGGVEEEPVVEVTVRLWSLDPDSADPEFTWKWREGVPHDEEVLFSVVAELSRAESLHRAARRSDYRIPDDELDVEVFRKGGPGGPSVNISDSAVRITHIPTGIVVEEGEQGNQIQNRAVALQRLRLLLDRRRGG